MEVNGCRVHEVFGPFCEVPSISNGAYKVGLLDTICVVFRDILSKSLVLKIG